MEKQHVSVVIVGAGPTGLTAANLLGMQGVETLLLERNSGISTYPRAITIDDDGLRVMQAINLREAIAQILRTDIQVHYLSQGRYLVRVTPGMQTGGYPLISTFHQPAFEAVLLSGLARFARVEVRFQHTLRNCEQQQNKVFLEVQAVNGQTYRVTCDYLLACDGGKSPIRHQLGIAMQAPRLVRFSGDKRNTLQKQRWLVVDCENDSDTSQETIFFCNPARPAVTVPAPQGRRRWEFMLLPGEEATTLQHSETIQQLIKQAQETRPEKAKLAAPQIVRYTVYTFYTLLAGTFARGRIFLLGDAAHLMPPFGGQGLNSGLRDAYNLCWKLSLVLHERTRPALLASYEQERRSHVVQMMYFSTLLGQLIMPTASLLAAARDLFFRGINKLPSLRHLLQEARIKPQPRYKQGCILPFNGRLRGKLLPQPPVRTLEGTQIMLDDALGNGFALLRLSRQPDTAFQSLQHAAWQKLPARYICIVPAGTTIAQQQSSPANQSTVVIDEQGVLEAWMDRDEQHYVLVRPDRYSMGTFSCEQEHIVVKWLDTFFSGALHH